MNYKSWWFLHIFYGLTQPFKLTEFQFDNEGKLDTSVERFRFIYCDKFDPEKNTDHDKKECANCFLSDGKNQIPAPSHKTLTRDYPLELMRCDDIAKELYYIWSAESIMVM
jgi:hypothetical protein